MDVGQPWTCAACGAGNAGYRKRCIGCSAKRTAGAEQAPAEPVVPVGPVDAGGIPMPRIAERRERSGSRWPGRIVTAAVLALAAYGAVQYFGGDRPSTDEDQAALLAALPDLGGSRQQQPFRFTDVVVHAGGATCEQLADELRELTGAHVTASVIAGRGAALEMQVMLATFDTARNAERYRSLIESDAVAGCLPDPPPDRVTATHGRALIVVSDRSDAERLIEQIVERLEIEG